MRKAMNWEAERNNDTEHLKKTVSKLRALTSLEKRMKDNGNITNIFTEQKNKLRNQIEKERRGI